MIHGLGTCLGIVVCAALPFAAAAAVNSGAPTTKAWATTVTWVLETGAAKTLLPEMADLVQLPRGTVVRQRGFISDDTGIKRFIQVNTAGNEVLLSSVAPEGERRFIITDRLGEFRRAYHVKDGKSSHVSAEEMAQPFAELKAYFATKAAESAPDGKAK